MNTLQSLTLPEIGLCTDEILYFRKTPLTLHSFQKKGITIPKFEFVDLFSYFNAFNLSKWCEATDNLALHARISGQGTVLIKWLHHESPNSTQVFQEDTLTLTSDAQQIEIRISTSKNQQGYISPLIYSISDTSEITRLDYITPTPPKNKVKLGIAITHFKREKQALSAIHRLSSELLSDEEFADSVELTVIDNSQSLPTISKNRVNIIKNKNYGGSGGFARGLLHYDLAGFSHCLFMDDDASCHVESIRRTIRFLKYAKDPTTAVCGAMLYEKQPHLQHENGAKFKNGCIPLGLGFNLHDRHRLFDNNRLPSPDYGAWWFFAFPIQRDIKYPFPFFVRGDDISFGLANNFTLKTLNGVCSWQEHFEGKASPLTTYLDARNHLVQFLTKKTDGSCSSAIKTYRQFVDKKCNSQLYESAEAGLLALRDVMKGPKFWETDLDMSKKRGEIGQLTKTEKPTTISVEHPPKATPPREKNRKRKRIARILSANGILLPTILLRNRPVIQKKSFFSDKDLTFRFKNILYYDNESQSGFITTYSKQKHISITISRIFLTIKFRLLYKTLSSKYTSAYSNLASKDFWLNQYHSD